MDSRSAAHLLGRLGIVEERIRHLVATRRQVDPDPDDPFRGLYLSDDAVDRLLASPREQSDWTSVHARIDACEAAADAAEEAGCRLRLRDLAAGFGLSSVDVDLLLVAMAADLDPRFEKFFGYLNDDVTLRRPTVALALDLAGVPISSAAAHLHLLHGPLIRGGLVELGDTDRAFPTRALRVPDRVSGFLVGDDTADPSLLGVIEQPEEVAWSDPAPLAAALADGLALAYLREPPTGSGRVLAVEALRLSGSPPLLVDLQRLLRQPDPRSLARTVVREVRLRGGGLVAGPIDVLRDGRNAEFADVVDLLQPDPRPLLLVGSVSWDPSWTNRPPAQVQVPASTNAERTALWRHALRGDSNQAVLSAAAQYRLRPEAVARAARAALAQSALDPQRRLMPEHVQTGARAENGSALEHLARRIDPEVGWDDLVLPNPVLLALHEVALRARHREQVLGDWHMRPGAGRGHSVVSLFAGDSGTGKTMSAEVIARDLGLELYVVDLATVVDKYIGETEKNLERIFTAASDVNAVLLFDEADAVFGKRSEVRDAHDRYANVESAYLLQRMESFDGLAVLATNLRANIDEAFTRRLDVIVDFPLPDAAHRRALWDRCLGTELRRSADLNLSFCADAFELAGGSIRSAAVTAAYLAAADSGVVGMPHLVTAVQREYRKLGRMCVESEFGRYWPLLHSSA